MQLIQINHLQLQTQLRENVGLVGAQYARGANDTIFALVKGAFTVKHTVVSELPPGFVKTLTTGKLSEAEYFAGLDRSVKTGK